MRALTALLAAGVLAGCARAPEDRATTLTYASPYSPMHPFSRADRAWMAWVEREAGGTLRIEPFWAGSLLSSEHSMTELRHGVADIGSITPIYARGGAHAIRMQAGFYAGLTTFAQQVALYRCLAAHDPQLARELDGLVVLAVQGGNLPGIVTRETPVKSLQDLRGLRLRAPAELLPILKHLGADPVDMPMGEVYPALAKGVLDGVVAPADTLRSLHFAEITCCFNTLAIPRGAYAARAMNERRWRALSSRQRAVLERSPAVWERALTEELERASLAGRAAGREHGVQFEAMPAADVERFLTLYDRHAERSAHAAQQYGIDGMKSYRHARKLAQRAAAGGGDVTCPEDEDGRSASR
jgi:TRAP-type transport system periplasmic protein